MSQALAKAERGAKGRPRRCWRLRLPLFATIVALAATPDCGARAEVAGSPATGSNVPVAATAPCPPGYYRRAVLVFACGLQDGEVYFQLANVSKTAVGIPKGIRNLKLTLDASGPVDVTIVDPATDTMVANGTAKLGAKATWNNVTIAFTSAPPSTGGAKQAVGFSGTLPGALSVKLANRLASQNLATITYSYEGFEGCPEVPVGCARYDQAAAREAVFNWSSWVSTKYPKAALAWQALASEAMHTRYGSSARAGPIPFHLWHTVWAKWPGAAKAEANNVDWQAAFKFIDSLHTEDQLVEVVEFIRAYKIAGIGLSMYNWCMALRTQYPDAATAWLAVAGPTSIAGVDYSRWKSAVWPSFVPLDDFAKASSAGSFQYADGSQNGVVSRTEFEAIYNSCDYRPASYATTSISGTTTLEPASSTDSSSTSMAAGASSSSTTAAAADAERARAGANASAANTSNASNASAGGQESGAPAARAAATASTTSTTAASTTTSSSGNSAGTPECCGEANATCLACEARESLAEFCGSSLGIDVEGCSLSAEIIDDHEEGRGSPSPEPALAPREAASGRLQAEAQALEQEVTDCPYPGVAYAPPLEKHNQTTEASASDCQARCAETAGCAYFSFRSTFGACNLHGPSAVWSLTLEPGAVAGPPMCIAKLGLHVSDVDFKALSDSQKRSTRQLVVADICNITGLPRDAVKDLDGNPGSVTLSAGSLVVSANLELPPGRTKSNASAHLGSEAFADRLRASLAEVGARAPVAGDQPVHHRHVVNMTMEVSHGCFLKGTRYGAPREGGQREQSEPASAANASACQAGCLEAKACEYFTFVPSTRECLFQSGTGVAPTRDQDAVSGPRQCAGLPVVPRSGWAANLGAGPGQAGQMHFSIWWLLLGASLGAIVLGAMALVLLTKRTKRKRGGKAGDYAPLSRQDVQDEEDGAASQSDGSEETDGNGVLEVDVHPFTMEAAGSRDEETGNARSIAGAAAREPPSLTVSSRELRAPGQAPPEVGSNLMSGFLGTEALRK